MTLATVEIAVEIVVGIPVLLFLLLLAVAGRNRLLQRTGGAVEISLRAASAPAGRGWSNGVGRFRGDELEWFRVFSLSPRPRRRLSRRALEVTGRREPADVEQRALHAGAVVLSCRDARVGREPVELAMQVRAVTGFLAWLEAAPPGHGEPA